MDLIDALQDSGCGVGQPGVDLVDALQDLVVQRPCLGRSDQVPELMDARGSDHSTGHQRVTQDKPECGSMTRCCVE